MFQTSSLRAAFAGSISLIAILLMWNSDKVVILQSTEPEIYRSPIFFPTIALIIIAICGISLVIQAFRKNSFKLDTDCEESKPKLLLSCCLLGLFFLYSLSIDWMGYFFSTLLFLMIAFFILGVKGKKNILFSVLISLSLYGVFAWALDIWFPEPWFSSIFAEPN